MNRISLGSDNGLSPIRRHYLNQCWVIVNWTLRNKIQWNFNQKTKLFIRETASENIVCQNGGHFVQGGDELNMSMSDHCYYSERHGVSNSTLCSTVCLHVHQRKSQSSVLLSLCEGKAPVVGGSPHKGSVTRESFDFMTSPWYHTVHLVWNGPININYITLRKSTDNVFGIRQKYSPSSGPAYKGNVVHPLLKIPEVLFTFFSLVCKFYIKWLHGSLSKPFVEKSQWTETS